MTYAYITAIDGASGKRVSKRIRIRSESDRFIVGVVVDDEGEEFKPLAADELLWLIDKGTITKRVPLQMNLTYGTLEEVPMSN